MQLIKKPWGYEKIIAHTKDYVGKILFIKKNSRLSLQYHKVKEETIYLYRGKLLLEIGKEKKKINLTSGESFHIKPKLIHRMHAQKN
jgi:mannose-6-phosphate isomerase-like protein (cupin superfamily)